ncbi:transposase [Staphylococcus gallinarum]
MVQKKRKFSKEFKEKVVNLYASGKTQKEIREEYDLVPSVLARWIKEAQFPQVSYQTNNSKHANYSKLDISDTIIEMEKDLKNSLSKVEKLQNEIHKENDKVANIKITLETLNRYLN